MKKAERIIQTKKLIEEGKIFFNSKLSLRNRKFVIGCDVSNGKDKTREWIFIFKK
jgi:hypothetical protein